MTCEHCNIYIQVMELRHKAGVMLCKAAQSTAQLVPPALVCLQNS